MPQRYSRIAILLHWTIAALLAFQITVGWALEDLGARGFALYQWHKSIGILILVLTSVRVAVRFWKPRPPKTERGWPGTLASAVHGGLYAFMIGAPLTGWALVSTARVKVPTLLFGVLPLPHLPLPASTHTIAESSHGLIAWLGIALFLLHVAGALRHHLLIGDGLVWRMIPGRSPVLIILLPALMIVGVVAGRAILPAPPRAAAQVAAPTPTVAAPSEPDPANSASVADPLVANAAEPPAPEAAGPPPAWTVQPGGTIRFSVANGDEQIGGSFARWTATIVMDPDHPETADIRVTIDMASASVGDAYKDGMLPGDEFFASTAHPSATFVAKGATATGPGRYRANGTLTLKGVARPQAIRFTLAGDGAVRTVTGSASITRTLFGVGNGDSSTSLAPDVAVRFDFRAKRTG